MPTQLREATRTARKVHHCESCRAMIKIGEQHHVSTNVWDGRVYDWRTCIACSKDNITSEVYFWAGRPDEGVDHESAWEWAHEYAASTSAFGDAARRWLVRSGCSCELCEARVIPPGRGAFYEDHERDMQDPAYREAFEQATRDIPPAEKGEADA